MNKIYIGTDTRVAAEKARTVYARAIKRMRAAEIQ
jgi:hypothetical protein